MTRPDGLRGATVWKLVRLWFSFDVAVDRRTYLIHGSLLVAFKYAVDAALVWLVLGTFWTPLDYLSPFLSDRDELFYSAPYIFTGALLLWTLPFLWIGVSMTMRRLIDAGRSPWLALLFFVPGINYILLASLCVAPSRTPEGLQLTQERAPVVDDRVKSAMTGIAVAVAIAVAMTGLSVFAFAVYGAALFLGTPFVMGLAAAYIHNRGHPRTRRSTLQVTVIAVALAGGALLLYGIEGIFCIAFAFPLALLLAVLGAMAGRVMAVRLPRRPGGAVAAVTILPLLALAETFYPQPGSREVVTAIEIDAPPEVVWQQVVSFNELPEPSEWYFRLGIAYPQRARIRGAGVGAVRRCEFSTGAFVEPITVWDAPRRLGFDVRSQPAPLHEWSPYSDIHPPHLDGYFRSQRGEFRLVELAGGRTRLEGSTWYRLDLYPQAYWRLYADALIHSIHRRVLAHVREQAEGAWRAQRPAPPTLPSHVKPSSTTSTSEFPDP